MDGLTLLRTAAAAGLSVRLDGERLVIRGPRSADAVAKLLIAEKPAVVAALQMTPATVCNHTLHHDDAGTTWSTVQRNGRMAIVCRSCPRFFGYLRPSEN